MFSVKDVCDNPDILTEVGIERSKHKKIMQNTKELSDYYDNNHHKKNN